LAYEPWPRFEESLTQDALVEIPVQVLGKLRGKIRVPADISDRELVAAAKGDKKVSPWLEGKQIVKEIIVRGRLVNFVVK
jgi:leucyl-tRNA synthetase